MCNAVKGEMIFDEEKLKVKIDNGRYEHDTEMVHEKLHECEMDRENRKTE